MCFYMAIMKANERLLSSELVCQPSIAGGCY